MAVRCFSRPPCIRAATRLAMRRASRCSSARRPASSLASDQAAAPRQTPAARIPAPPALIQRITPRLRQDKDNMAPPVECSNDLGDKVFAGSGSIRFAAGLESRLQGRATLTIIPAVSGGEEPPSSRHRRRSGGHQPVQPEVAGGLDESREFAPPLGEAVGAGGVSAEPIPLLLGGRQDEDWPPPRARGPPPAARA